MRLSVNSSDACLSFCEALVGQGIGGEVAVIGIAIVAADDSLAALSTCPRFQNIVVSFCVARTELGAPRPRRSVPAVGGPKAS